MAEVFPAKPLEYHPHALAGRRLPHAPGERAHAAQRAVGQIAVADLRVKRNRVDVATHDIGQSAEFSQIRHLVAGCVVEPDGTAGIGLAHDRAAAPRLRKRGVGRRGTAVKRR